MSIALFRYFPRNCKEKKTNAFDFAYVLQPKKINLKCNFQVNETMTVFMGGSRYPRGIITFDWTTMTYTKQSTELIRNRTWTSCALLKGVNGENLVAVAGGQSGVNFINILHSLFSYKSLFSSFPLVTCK
jgi:hypothetical protein